MGNVFHHINLRRRIHLKKQKYPSKNRWKRFLDHFIYFSGMLGPILTVPQIMKIFSTQSAAGNSIITWASYLFGSIIFLIYAIVHKAKPLIVIYSSWILANIAVVIGILIYS